MEEYIEYNKIYAHADKSGKVTDIFSVAFKTPDENDICIDERNTDRHGAQCYQVYDEYGVANYAIVNGALIERDKTAEITKIKTTIEYPKIVENKIRTKYSVSAELAILRQRETKPEEFAEYNAFCEACKAEAKDIVDYVLETNDNIDGNLSDETEFAFNTKVGENLVITPSGKKYKLIVDDNGLLSTSEVV